MIFKGRKKIVLLGIVAAGMLFACKNSYSPRPRGYFRIDFPEKEYVLFDSTCPYKFEMPVYATIENNVNNDSTPCFINLAFPALNSKIHISYLPVQDNLGLLLEEAHKFAYKHVQKADGIDRKLISYPAKNVYGMLYNIKGNVASSCQFYLTDSVRHYFRGALYFYEKPNKDSIAPVLDFINLDILRMIESFEWK